MNKILFAVIFLIFISNAFAQNAKSEDVKNASEIPDRLFAAMKAKSFEGIKNTFMPAGQLVAIDKPRDGKGISKTRIFTVDEFRQNDLRSERRRVYRKNAGQGCAH